MICLSCYKYYRYIWNHSELDAFGGYELKQLCAKNNRRRQQRLHFYLFCTRLFVFLAVSYQTMGILKSVVCHYAESKLCSLFSFVEKKNTTSAWGTCPHPVLCSCFHWQMFQRLLGSAIAPLFLRFLQVCRNSELKCKTPEAWEAVFCQQIEQSVTCLISYVKQLELWHY